MSRAALCRETGRPVALNVDVSGMATCLGG
jgi:hypothetical protein